MCAPASLLVILSSLLMAAYGTISPQLISAKAKVSIPRLPAISIALAFAAAVTDEFSGMSGKAACDIALASLAMLMLQWGLSRNYFIAHIVLNLLSLCAGIAAILSGERAGVSAVFCTIAAIYTLTLTATVAIALKNSKPAKFAITGAVADLIYLVLTFGVICFSLTTSAVEDLQSVFDISLTGFSCAVLVLNITRYACGQSFVLLSYLEREYATACCKQMRERRLDYEERNAVYSMVFKRVQQFLEDKMPFLDDDFSLSRLSEEIFTNKHYVSRAISECSGMNFCQFINTYRIRYAIDCIQHNPRLKVSELAVMCGFKTQSSFNQAFRKYTGDTPSDWVRRNFRKTEGSGDAVLQN